MVTGKNLYSKIQIVLDEAKKGKASSRSDIIRAIDRRKPSNFIYFNKKKDESVCSENSIKRAVKLCYDFQLLRPESGQLSRVGMSAIEKGKFDHVLGREIELYLERNGVTKKNLNDAIENCLLRKDPPVIPVPENIWDELKRPMDLIDFKTCLTLLSQCGILTSFQRKIYLPVNFQV